MEGTIKAIDEKGVASLRRVRIFAAVLMYIAAVLAIGCLIGIVVGVLMLNFGERSSARDTMLYILTGSFAGGAIVMALCAFLVSRLVSAYSQKELDARERLDGEESFFVGEGTLMTFGDKGVTLHGEVPGKAEPVSVPYHDMRFISICTRRRPRERGSWCVAIEIPVKYVSKNKETKGDEKVLVQADAKDRLYEALEKHELTLLGEERKEGVENRKFTLVQKFKLPNRKKRKKTLIPLVLGAVLVAGAIPLGIFVSITIGALVGAVGIVVLTRSVIAFVRAKAVFGVYEEGIFWLESSRKECMFLKWEDIERVSFGEQNGFPALTFHCVYGKYAIPAAEGAYECIEKNKEEKCTKE